MGRITPNSQIKINIPSTITLSLFVGWIAAITLVIAGLCASHLHRKHRRKKSPATEETFSPLHPPTNNITVEDSNVDQLTSKPLAIPPANLMSSENPTTLQMCKTRSRRKLSGSFSMKLPDGLAKIRTLKKEQKVEEDTIWKKTIIMGERCRTPGEEDDDVAVYDEKGNRQRIYHPKTPRSLPASRTNSFTESKLSYSDALSFL